MNKSKLPWNNGDLVFDFQYDKNGVFKRGNNRIEFVPLKGHDCVLVLNNGDFLFPPYPTFAAFFINNKEYWFPDFSNQAENELMAQRFIEQSGCSDRVDRSYFIAALEIMYEYWITRKESRYI